MEFSREYFNELVKPVLSELAEGIKNIGSGTPEEEAQMLRDFLWSHGTFVTKWAVIEKMQEQTNRRKEQDQEIQTLQQQQIDQLTEYIGLLEHKIAVLKIKHGEDPFTIITPN